MKTLKDSERMRERFNIEMTVFLKSLNQNSAEVLCFQHIFFKTVNTNIHFANKVLITAE